MAKAKSKKKATTNSKPRTKTELYRDLADATGLTRKDISAVFDNLETLMRKDLKRGPGVFAIPGLMKVKVIRKPATKARKGINPFTKEETVFKAKPARNVVKVQALKNLKTMV